MKNTDTNNTNSTGSVKICSLLLFFIFSIDLSAQTSENYNTKALFLYNFSRFIDWPADNFPAPTAPFVIVILGTDPFGKVIDDDVAGEKVKEHPVIVERYQNVKDIKNCQILFISNSESDKLKEILTALPGKNVLTVGESPDFITNGGMVRFMTKGSKIKIQINLPASRATDMNISSKLLKVADIVR